MRTDQKITVFLGPSFDFVEAQNYLKANFIPPAKRGDFRKFCLDSHTVVVLIDGEMIFGAPPSPQELLDVMASGVHLFGAASLGALRGVELRDYGFKASGWVYEEYLSGRVKHDDELLSILHPETFLPLTVPLINIRYALSLMTSRYFLSVNSAQKFLGGCREIFFEDRTEQEIKRLGLSLGLDERLVGEIFSSKYDIKKIDAIECLQKVKRFCEAQA
ncbi:TfuA-like protein [Glaciimonas immobilis]|uniref:TfuA-like core domain-containing protein n=1 Tax=Glaciimonas immobilis TaxID=728004 RepID=A0A840RRT0_9BURK|nr:TfuA-like protein [Glaciimonas immobilis]KAF3997024.1 hypothetical protein HAV38_15210 [Glaciimonas immobilis]MBB5199862.1 hypothetical protein [Glaciimonas immobilis]